MAGVGGKHSNSKTLMSVDFTTVCNGTCAYCYVAASRRGKGFRAKGTVDYEPYDGFVRRLKKETIAKLNAIGGIRLFSFADYFRKHDMDIRMFLDDCSEVGLWVKALTKRLEFVDKYINHPALKVINISVDNIAGGKNCGPVTFRAARRYRDKYHKVLVRCAALDYIDVDFFGEQPWMDVITLNHGRNGFHSFTNMEKQAVGKKYPGRVCCLKTTCEGCMLRCGLDKLGHVMKG